MNDKFFENNDNRYNLDYPPENAVLNQYNPPHKQVFNI
jgi:hypothetical protein